MNNFSVGVNSTVHNNSGVQHAVRCLPDDSITKIFKVIAYSIIMVLSIVGNSVLALVYFKGRNMKNTVNRCIMNMVFADALVTLVYMPRMISRILDGLQWRVEGTAGLILCKIVSLSQEVSICVSILTIVIIAFERFFAVAFPLRVYISKRVSLGLLCGAWVASLAARSPMLHAVRTVRINSGEINCLWIHILSFKTEDVRNFYNKFMLITFYALPLCCIIVLYTAIMIILKRREALIDNPTRNRALMTNKKVTKMILVVITAFLLCWLLYFLVIPLEEIWNIRVSCDVHFMRFFMGHANSACNPIICMKFSENYRNGLKNIVRKRKKPKLHSTSESDGRYRSRSNIALLSIRTLELHDSFEFNQENMSYLRENVDETSM